MVGWGWALIQGWVLINFFCLYDGRLFEVRANSWALIQINMVFKILQKLIKDQSVKKVSFTACHSGKL